MDVNPEFLFDNPAGYDSADLIVATPEELGWEQALKDWVSAGGVAVVPGIVDRVGLSGSYPDIIPVTPKSTGKLSLRIGGSTSAPVDIIKCVPRPGARVLVEREGVPIVVEKRFGLGRVIYLAFDPAAPALLSQPGYVQFWRDILQASTSDLQVIRYWSDSTGYEKNLGHVSNRMDTKPPPAGTIGAFLGLYILLLVPANYFILKRIRRKELAWVTVPSLVIIFSLAAYIIGAAGRERHPIVKSASLAETAAGSDVANSIACASLFSPGRTRYNLEFSDSSVLVADDPVFSRSSAYFPALESVRGARELHLPRTDVYMWSLRTMAIKGVRRLGGKVTARLTTDGARVQGTISSSLPFTLRNCVLYGDRFKCDIGTLSPGDIAKVSHGYGAEELPTPVVPKWYHAGSYRSRVDIEMKVLIHKLQYNMPIPAQPGELLLVGWMSKPVWDMKVDGRKMPAEHADAIFVHVYPEWRERPDGRIAGSVGGRVHEIGKVTADDGYRASDGPLEVAPIIFREGSLHVQYQLPFDSYTSRLTRLALECQLSLLSSPPPVVARKLPENLGVIGVEVYDFQHRHWRPIGAMTCLGAVRLAIPDPEQTVGPGGVVKIALTRSSRSEKPLVLHKLRLAFEGRMK